MKRKPTSHSVLKSKKHTFVPGPDPLYPRVTYEDASVISLQRLIDVDLWKRGEPYPPAIAKRFALTGEHRRVANNPATKRIVAEKTELRRKIANSEQLVKDFEFFTRTLGWHPENLLQHLYWDANMMHADPQTVVANEKKNTWPIERDALVEIRTNLRVLIEQVERLTKTDFSPTRSVILRDEDGRRLHSADEKYLVRAFRNLPAILSFYVGELSRKLSLTDISWPRESKRWKSLVEHARKTSLYENIRAKTGKYHTVRLHRLVNASRQTQGLPEISQRAFVVWLNRLKKRCEINSISPTPLPSPEGSQSSLTS